MGDKGKYIVKVEAAEGCNPEYAPDQRMQEGIPCGGFLLLMFNEDDEPQAENMMQISVEMLARLLRKSESSLAPIIRQACAIAEGYLKAQEIDVKKRAMEGADSIAGSIFEFLKTNLGGRG